MSPFRFARPAPASGRGTRRRGRNREDGRSARHLQRRTLRGNGQGLLRREEHHRRGGALRVGRQDDPGSGYRSARRGHGHPVGGPLQRHGRRPGFPDRGRQGASPARPQLQSARRAQGPRGLRQGQARARPQGHEGGQRRQGHHPRLPARPDAGERRAHVRRRGGREPRAIPTPSRPWPARPSTP